MSTHLNKCKLSCHVMSSQLYFHHLFVICRFYQNLQAALSTEKLKKLQIPDPVISKEQHHSHHRLEKEKGEETTEQEEKNKPSVYQRRRKREKPSVTNCCHGDGSSIVPELDDCLDLFTWSSGSFHNQLDESNNMHQLNCTEAVFTDSSVHYGSGTFLLQKRTKKTQHVLHLYTVEILEYNQQRRLTPVKCDKEEEVVQGVIC